MKKHAIVIFIIIILFIIGFLIDNIDLIKYFSTFEGLQYLKTRLSSYKYGIIILLIAQILQVVIFVIPSEIIEILSGLMYGPYLGFLVCMLGNIIGSVLIYFCVKKFDIRIKKEYVIKNYEFMVFFVYLLPFTPKDLFNYIIPMTNMNKYSFFIISNVARIPSILTSTLFIDLYLKNNNLGVIIYLLSFVIGIMVLNIVKGSNKYVSGVKKCKKNI